VTLSGPPPPAAQGAPPGAAPRRRHTARWVAGAVAVVLVVVAVVVATRPSEEATAVDSPLIGHAAPPLVARDFSGHLVSLAADRGDVVVLDFFASWCPPCAAEQPNLARLAFETSRQHADVRLVSVDIDDSTAGARRFLDSWGVTWPAVPDHAGQYASEFGVGSPPMTFFLDTAGTVEAAFSGPMSYGQLTSTLASLRRG
jgi:cytochrome c biogenesis protein CcmG, thiol:disulfide interchange protein DsbE